jgi:hypothetical protein
MVQEGASHIHIGYNGFGCDFIAIVQRNADNLVVTAQEFLNAIARANFAAGLFECGG